MRKLILSILILMMFNTVAYAYTDVSDEVLSTKLNDLSKYNIINGYEDGTFRPDNSITRAEFSKIIMCATMNDYITEYEKGFTDVADGSWAEKYIYSAKMLGIVNGTTESTFEPEANITNEQAIKMIVCSLGYSEEAIAAGGYPDGYIEIAKNIGIISNSNFDSKAISTRRGIAEMVYKALDSELYFIYIAEDGSIERSKAENTLREIHELSIDNSINDVENNNQINNELEVDSVG